MIITLYFGISFFFPQLILTKPNNLPHNITRYMKVLKGFVSNYARPEGSIANRYLSLECVRFCETFLKKTRNPPGYGDIRAEALVEEHPLSTGKSITLDGKDIATAHRYVLFNLAVTESFLK